MNNGSRRTSRPERPGNIKDRLKAFIVVIFILIIVRFTEPDIRSADIGIIICIFNRSGLTSDPGMNRNEIRPGHFYGGDLFSRA